ncbi:hypothetical protein IQ64_07600 [Streptomyces stelliscabiei]|nr:hypothetical protein IQ64_07600 [Streptomyces stelliscabiei]
MAYSTEADARTAFRQLAEAYGWLAREEVVIPGWGRIDLVLRSTEAASPVLIELKKELKKPSEIRKAFQQADGYGRWWALHKDESVTSLLVGMECDWAQVQPVADAYPQVKSLSGAGFMTNLFNWRLDPGTRAPRARERLASLEALLAIHRLAVEEMDTESTQSPYPTETDSV